MLKLLQRFKNIQENDFVQRTLPIDWRNSSKTLEKFLKAHFRCLKNSPGEQGWNGTKCANLKFHYKKTILYISTKFQRLVESVPQISFIT